ncbi:MAG: glycine cleavage system aminomethyltransferase GcvT [Noviherbaspirillum sp.]
MTDDTLPLARTPLYSLHRELGARMVPFAGYEMPVQYPAGVLKEHKHTRDQASLFDVSHMGQLRLSGPDAAGALETLVPADIAGLGPDRQRYAFFTNEVGGILDDLMVANRGDHLYLVVNAARKRHDLAHLQTRLAESCQVEELSDRALLALQGPAAAAVLARLAPASAGMAFMESALLELDGVPCLVSRSGYTGEDGFEISVPAAAAEQLARDLLAQPEVAPAGLGARDSLRLEAGLCLYGHDIDTVTTPVEAGLAWAVPSVRRAGGARAGGFPGADAVLRQLAQGVGRKRVGLLVRDRLPVREGAALEDGAGRAVGHVTSGGFSPTLGQPVAQGYVDTAHAAIGTALAAIVRGKPVPVEVVRMPFVAHRYRRA